MKPWLVFEDNFRPAALLLQVYRLLESERGPVSSGEMVERMRKTLGPSDEPEDLLVLLNDLFVGVVREAARVPAVDLKLKSLQYLLRQSVVAACSALDAYLPLLLRTHLPTVIRVRGRDFAPTDKETKDFLGDFKLDIHAVLRLMTEQDPERFLGSMLLNHLRSATFGNSRGVHATGALLGLAQPWDQLAERLDQKAHILRGRTDAIAERRNDIVHRADRPRLEPDGTLQEIHLSWTNSHVNTVRDVAMALNELVEQQIRDYEALAPVAEAVSA